MKLRWTGAEDLQYVELDHGTYMIMGCVEEYTVTFEPAGGGRVELGEVETIKEARKIASAHAQREGNPQAKRRSAQEMWDDLNTIQQMVLVEFHPSYRGTYAPSTATIASLVRRGLFRRASDSKYTAGYTEVDITEDGKAAVEYAATIPSERKWMDKRKANPKKPKAPLDYFPIRRVCTKGRGQKATCKRAPVLCGRCLQRTCGHLSGTSTRVDLDTGERINYLDPRPYAITLGTCSSCTMKRGGWKLPEAIAAVRERVGGAHTKKPKRKKNPVSVNELVRRALK